MENKDFMLPVGGHLLPQFQQQKLCLKCRQF